MKALMALALLLGVLAVLSPSVSHRDDYAPVARTVALNYAIYRNAAFLYALEHKPNGTISQAVLELPDGWHALRAWTARVEGGRCYVYGPASMEEVAAARELFQGSFAVGHAENGRLMPDGLAPLPAFIPGGSLASVVEVDDETH